MAQNRSATSSHRKKRRGHGVVRLIKLLIALILLVPISAIAINLFMYATTTNNMWYPRELAGTNADYIVVLGAGIEPDGTPSPVLAERLDTAIVLYENGASKHIIVSGGEDAAQSEVSAMRNYLLDSGIPSLAITTDTHGVDTYASVNNLTTLYDAHSVILVSQRFHLYRAVYIAEHLNLEAYGCPASQAAISDKNLLVREFFARIKDFTQCTVGELPEPLANLATSAYNHYIAGAIK